MIGEHLPNLSRIRSQANTQSSLHVLKDYSLLGTWRVLAAVAAPRGYRNYPRSNVGLPAGAPEARGIIETPTGEEYQVDYGTGPVVRDTNSGKYRRTRLARPSTGG